MVQGLCKTHLDSRSIFYQLNYREQLHLLGMPCINVLLDRLSMLGKTFIIYGCSVLMFSTFILKIVDVLDEGILAANIDTVNQPTNV